MRTIRRSPEAHTFFVFGIVALVVLVGLIQATVLLHFDGSQIFGIPVNGLSVALFSGLVVFVLMMGAFKFFGYLEKEEINKDHTNNNVNP